MGNYMLDKVRTAACSRNQHIRRQGRGSLSVYVRMNIHYDHSPREEALRDTISPFWLLGQVAVIPWNSLFFTRCSTFIMLGMHLVESNRRLNKLWSTDFPRFSLSKNRKAIQELYSHLNIS